MSSTEDQRKIIARVSMAALAIDPHNPRPESVKLLRELNAEMERLLTQKTGL